MINRRKTVAGNVVKLLYRADAIFIQIYLNIHTCMLLIVVVIVVEGVQNSVGIFILIIHDRRSVAYGLFF